MKIIITTDEGEVLTTVHVEDPEYREAVHATSHTLACAEASGVMDDAWRTMLARAKRAVGVGS